MANYAATISGAYAVSDKVGIKAFIDSVAPNKLSGSSVFIIPVANGQQAFIGVLS